LSRVKSNFKIIIDGELIEDDLATNWDDIQSKLKAFAVQSSAWARFNNQLGKKVFGVAGDSWSCLMVEYETPVGKYWYAAYGPTIKSQSDYDEAVECIADVARSRGIAWLKVEPRLSDDFTAKSPQRINVGSKAKKTLGRANPSRTIVNDLTLGEEELFKSMSSSNRNLIRRATKKNDLKFTTSTDPKDIELFIKMEQSVRKRNNVEFHSKDYYQVQAQTLMPAGLMCLEIAYLDDEPVSTIVVYDFAGISSYIYAASLAPAFKSNANLMLAWEAIQNACKRGNSYFDFWGIAPENAGPNHPWAGFTMFKTKFGGRAIDYSGTYEIPLGPRYYLFRVLARLNRARRALKKTIRSIRQH
jgi:lipid II:glycine glycyltransferase (peptidoglycan interpeptide bridge formation enzyme)